MRECLSLAEADDPEPPVLVGISRVILIRPQMAGPGSLCKPLSLAGFAKPAHAAVLRGVSKTCLGQRRGCALIAAVRLADLDQRLVVRGLRLGRLEEGVDPRQNQNRDEDENGGQDDLEG